MSAVLKIPFRAVTPVPTLDLTHELTPLADALRSAFGVTFSFWCAESGELLLPTLQQPGINDPLRGELTRGVTGPDAQFVADEDSVLLLAIPFAVHPGITAIAISAFVVRQPEPQESLAGPAQLLGIDEARAATWIQRQTIWSPESLLRLASAVQRAIQAEAKVYNLQREVEKLSDNLASTYEEICLLHGVTQNLRISADDEQLGSLVLNWLLDCTPAQSLAIQLLPVASAGETTYKARTQNTLLSAGKCLLTSDQFSRLVEHLQLTAGCGPVVMNENSTGTPDWPAPQIRQLI
ncbi:MAG: HD-GYP domain-containing protein, partial [Pirellulaceae bacterium]